jgi:hypothetical protein
VHEPQPPLKVKGYIIAPELFRRGFRKGGGPCTCTSRCCSGGVYVDLREHDLILEHRELVKRHMDETQTTDESRWFEDEAFDHGDFPSGRCIGTQEINDKCTFLDRQGRCSLQLASVANGRHKWHLKPLYCVLYPIEISDGVIGFDDLLQEEERCCTISDEFTVPLFEGCREELVHLLGEDGYAAIAEHYASLTRCAEGTQP